MTSIIPIVTETSIAHNLFRSIQIYFKGVNRQYLFVREKKSRLAKMSSSALAPYTSHFQGKTKLTSCEFLKIFKQFDKDGNGFIEEGELDDFLEALWKESKAESELSIEEMKDTIMKTYDTNYDKKIDLEELARILPTEENFLAQFQCKVSLTSVDFFKVWHHYDSDRSGFIESEELQAFLTDLLDREGRALSCQTIEDYSNAMLALFDRNKDGKLSLSEMSKLLPVEENILLGFERDNMTEEKFNELWLKYDQDGNGFIADAELDTLIHDMIQTDDAAEFKKVKDTLLAAFDTDKDGKFKKDEFKMLLVG